MNVDNKQHYIATLRCQSWNVWPELSAIEAKPFLLDVGAPTPIPATAAVLSYLNRTKPEVYGTEDTKNGPLLWDGTVPGMHLVRDTLLKDPADTVMVTFDHKNAKRGEIDIVFAFQFTDPLPANASELIGSALFAFMSLTNLRLSDFLIPAAPVQISKVEGSQRRIESMLKILVLERKVIPKDDLAQEISGIARTLSAGTQSEKLRTALELYGAHFHEPQARTRFLLLVIAIEALANPTPRPQIAVDLITKWQDDVNAAQNEYDKTSEEYAALEALNKELFHKRQNSVRSQVRELARKSINANHPDAVELPRRALKVYDARSRLVHEGSLPAEELASVEIEARAIFETIIKAITATTDETAV